MAAPAGFAVEHVATDPRASLATLLPLVSTAFVQSETTPGKEHRLVWAAHKGRVCFWVEEQIGNQLAL